MKRQFTITAILIVVLTAITVYSLKAQSEYVKYYFDNNFADSSGNSNDGTGTIVSYTTDIAGLPNKAASFNGTSSFLSVPNSWVGGTMFGVSLWFKTSNHHAPAGLVYAGLEGVNVTPTNFTPLMYLDSAGHLDGFFYDGSSLELQSTDTVNDDKWHHAVFHVRVNPMNGQVHQEMWIDGKMDQSRDMGINTGNNSFANIFVGACNARNLDLSQLPDQWEFFGGAIDNVIFWLGGTDGIYYHHLDLLITEHPQSQAKNVGQSLTMHISHTYFNPDSTYTYQWKKNGTDIAGATDSVFNIPSVALADAGNYTCTVQTVDSYKVISEAAVITVSPVGIENTSMNNKIKFYPNPSNDVLTIIMEQEPENANIQVLSIDGKTMLSHKLTKGNVKLNIANLPAAMYLLRLTNAGTVSNAYFMKQ